MDFKVFLKLKKKVTKMNDTNIIKILLLVSSNLTDNFVAVSLQRQNFFL